MTTREVVLDGGSPWGFRLHGGADVNQPLRISRVNPGSKAALRGIREGDFITSINGQSTKDISNADAHSLLKNSGDNLKLGLNEDNSGSPKRRQYKTVHQETHSETVKRSSITSYTLTSSKTTSQTEISSNDIAKVNGNSNVNGDSINDPSKNPIASQKSTLSSNSSSTTSTPSTYTEAGLGVTATSRPTAIEDTTTNSAMSDNAINTRTRRKRSRNHRKKTKNNGGNSQSPEIVTIVEDASNNKCSSDNNSVTNEEKSQSKQDYRVESPTSSTKNCDVKTNGSKMPAKSKSLDDDEMIKIQELSEVSESEDKGESKAIVSEAESDVEREISATKLSSMSLPLATCVAQEISLISPEEELTLRNFLETLNLVNSPEDAAKQVYETSTIESIRTQKAKKRAALEQYFTPIAQNPRYLDVISEENSDLSDREQQSVTHYLKQGTPELEIPEAAKPPLVPKRRENKKLQQRMLFCAPAILVGTKLVDHQHERDGCSSNITHNVIPLSSSEAEIVYLEDSSNSTTPDPKSDQEVEDLVSSTDSNSAPELFKNDFIEETEVVVEKQQAHITVKKGNNLVSETHTSSCEKIITLPLTDEANKAKSHDEILTQLTPPPTPDDMSPKNETLETINIVDDDILSFIRTASSYLTDRNPTGIQDIIKDTRFKVLPNDIKNKLKGYLQSQTEKIIYSSAISPPPPSLSPSPSPSLSFSSGSSSRATSLCTAKYNPMNSSIADIESLNKDEELLKNVKIPTLREMCLNYLMTQPFGPDVLQELAEVSLSIEKLTSNLSNNVLSSNIPAFMAKSDPCKNINSSVEVPVKTGMPTGNWVGLPTEEDPKLLVCFSPTQKSELDKSKKVADEAGKLLDLHEKFIYRRTCYDKSVDRQVKSKVEITSIKDDAKLSQSSGNNVSNRLLAILRDDPGSHASTNSHMQESQTDDYLFFAGKDCKETPTKPSSATLPRFKSEANMDSARLKAKDLTEWLQLARNKSTSESNLTAIGAKRAAVPQVPTNNPARAGNDFRSTRRRTSLPQELYQQQMQYLLEKERDIQRELEYLEDEKRKLAAEMTPSHQFHPEDYHISRKGDFAENKKSRPVSLPIASEFFRQQMYEEYMDQVAAREERKQLKVIKVTSSPNQTDSVSDKSCEQAKQPSGIGDEFMNKVKQKQDSGKLLPESEDNEPDPNLSGDKSDDDSEAVIVIDGDSVKGARKWPKHLQEFIDMTKHAAENSPENSDAGVWSPGQKPEFKLEATSQRPRRERQQDEPISPIWTPKSATSSPTVERKEFRPVKFDSPVLNRKSYSRGELSDSSENISREPPWKIPDTSSEIGVTLSSTLQKRLPTSHSSPASGFNDFSTTRLPRAQNPTITLLQKAREGQLPKGALYIEQEQNYRRPHNEKPPIIGPGEVLYQIKNEYTSESDSERPRKMADLGPRRFEGVGPTTKDGMPIILRSEVRDANQSKWYKKMYDTIHKQKPHRDEYVTVRYRQKRDKYPYFSGYLSEPEPGAYDSDFTDYKYATLDRRRVPYRDKENDYNMSSTMPRTTTITPESKAPPEIVRYINDPSKNPRRIENYTTGHSSITDKEAKEWWDEVMDIFDGHLEQQKRVPQQQLQQPPKPPPQPHPKSFINQALKESGYESDSTLVFRRRDETAHQLLSPLEQKEAYKVIQKGGDVPLHGLRKPAPERPKEPEPPVPPPKGQHGLRNLQPESPRKYVENEVTIHYKTPVRQEIKEYLSEDELAYRQAEAMKKIYQEERRRKYLQVSKSLQELQDMNNRRHTDNFIPSQKSPISLNRYDDFEDLAPPVKPRPRSPEPRLLARALYNFVGQTARELTFRKGDLIYVRRQVDKNWYEGELNAMVGLFPVNYVEIVTYDSAKTTPRKSHEGQARAKYNFVAQTHLELSLAKGELVTITRKVDDNWYEGKIGGRKGIFPAAYVEILIDPGSPLPPSTKPVAAPAAHSLLLNGSAGGKESMGSHSYTPNVSSNQLTSSYHAKPAQVVNSGNCGSASRPGKNNVSQALHIETQSEPVPYRALYKYLPQNDDELELLEGDTVYVLEKCDDGWYVGSSDRTGAFGTFPGNYVEKI